MDAGNIPVHIHYQDLTNKNTLTANSDKNPLKPEKGRASFTGPLYFGFLAQKERDIDNTIRHLDFLQHNLSIHEVSKDFRRDYSASELKWLGESLWVGPGLVVAGTNTISTGIPFDAVIYLLQADKVRDALRLGKVICTIGDEDARRIYPKRKHQQINDLAEQFSTMIQNLSKHFAKDGYPHKWQVVLASDLKEMSSIPGTKQNIYSIFNKYITETLSRPEYDHYFDPKDKRRQIDYTACQLADMLLNQLQRKAHVRYGWSVSDIRESWAAEQYTRRTRQRKLLEMIPAFLNMQVDVSKIITSMLFKPETEGYDERFFNKIYISVLKDFGRDYKDGKFGSDAYNMDEQEVFFDTYHAIYPTERFHSESLSNNNTPNYSRFYSIPGCSPIAARPNVCPYSAIEGDERILCSDSPAIVLEKMNKYYRAYLGEKVTSAEGEPYSQRAATDTLNYLYDGIALFDPVAKEAYRHFPSNRYAGHTPQPSELIYLAWKISLILQELCPEQQPPRHEITGFYRREKDKLKPIEAEIETIFEMADHEIFDRLGQAPKGHPSNQDRAKLILQEAKTVIDIPPEAELYVKQIIGNDWHDKNIDRKKERLQKLLNKTYQEVRKIYPDPDRPKNTLSIREMETYIKEIGLPEDEREALETVILQLRNTTEDRHLKRATDIDSLRAAISRQGDEQGHRSAMLAKLESAPSGDLEHLQLREIAKTYISYLQSIPQ